MKVTQEYIESLDKKHNHILVCKTACAFPVSFITHVYIVIVKQGVTTRYDVIDYPIEENDINDYLYKNYYKPWEGILWIYTKSGRGSGPRSQPKLINHFSSMDNKEIDHLIEQIENLYTDFPGRYEYRYWGPNYNTFVQRIINKTRLPVNLPKNAWGKGHKIANS